MVVSASAMTATASVIATSVTVASSCSTVSHRFYLVFTFLFLSNTYTYSLHDSLGPDQPQQNYGQFPKTSYVGFQALRETVLNGFNVSEPVHPTAGWILCKQTGKRFFNYPH
jgi:hypothetical protein